MRCSIAISLLASCVLVTLSLLLESELHPLLQDYLTLEFESQETRSEVIALYVGGVAAIVYLVASIGQLFGKQWAKQPFIYSVIAGYLSVPFFGPVVELGLVVGLEFLTAICDGAVIALILFTDALEDESVLA